MGPSPDVWFLDWKQRLLDWNYKALWVKNHTCCFCMQNCDFWTRITNLYGSQTLPVVLCMKNSNYTSRLQFWMGPRPHLRFWALITACLAQEQKNCIGSRPHLWFCACITASLGLELQVSVGPRPNLRIMHAKQRLLAQDNKSLCFPRITCHFVQVQERA